MIVFFEHRFQFMFCLSHCRALCSVTQTVYLLVVSLVSSYDDVEIYIFFHKHIWLDSTKEGCFYHTGNRVPRFLPVEDNFIISHMLLISETQTVLRVSMKYSMDPSRIARLELYYLGHHWLFSRSELSHYPKQCLFIVNWTLWNKLQWNLNWNLNFFTEQKYLIISWYLHVWNGVAVAAYSRLASRSQAKFHTKKLSPLVRPCAAAPAQSTTSAYRSLDFRRATSSQRGRWVGSWPLLLRSVHEDTS